MPTYEYVCSKCGLEFEKFQPIADQPLNVCPQDVCAQRKWGRGAVKRKISAGGGLIFKGSGFYITDYAKKDHVAAEKADKAEGGKAEGGKAEGGKAESGKAETSEKAEKSEKSEKSDKAETSARTERSGAGTATTSSGDSASSSASSTTKDSAKEK